jgi:hypothetical protein
LEGKETSGVEERVEELLLRGEGVAGVVDIPDSPIGRTGDGSIMEPDGLRVATEEESIGREPEGGVGTDDWWSRE